MVGPYLLVLAVVILQSSAIGKDFNGLSSNYKNKLRCYSEPEQVKIQLLYECLCIGSRMFISGDFKDVVLKLEPYLNVTTYPYGNAETKEEDGRVVITCQHGPPECYGNKLHACAIDNIQNKTEALLYNVCMLRQDQAGYGSDDKAADACGKSMKIDSEPIKKCAKNERGDQLLKYYGDESKKIHYDYVPYVLINGVELTPGDDFFTEACKAFKNPPSACSSANKV